MSVFIKGFDKPKSCFGCDFNMYDCYCKINHSGIDRDFWFCDKTCPLVEVPVPHGRLIEVTDELLTALSNFIAETGIDEAPYMSASDWIEMNAPTVIEAEGVE